MEREKATITEPPTTSVLKIRLEPRNPSRSIRIPPKSTMGMAARLYME